ncbi:Bifunctional inhibitor/plant lipid transfer protein/seed storage helical domain - like 10 [Theobroma cacao]|uniref:Uncharacterized protein LOC18589930 n=2 Tax=Theobroma cacao TaxID=3641 RepID=A0AB32URY3_THECC|nr:PREDICTED: uncharacterized protein LOC18589930 [Theobroma cacao]EOY32804.1 Lipid binding protein, putative [Theobroma cacao]WRX31809.1 Bifunctional inhibitor/plant lipid transfer protein/seed storage helical domain - like 10 [Theobroma cacao]WRX32796.1 Bifunctional inhibitor/plant lipid transfer protein/seed storage helical domain - like 10 [Theobroma cacao]
MASASFRFLTLAILVIAGTLVFGNHGVSADCKTSIPSLISQCSKYVQVSGPEIPPSQGCCDVMKDLDIPCLCNLVTPEVEKLVSMEKVVFVARTCGLTLEPGMKCGSFTVPPA